MISFILDFIVNVIILAVVIPVSGYIFGFTTSFMDPVVRTLGLPVSQVSEVVTAAVLIVCLVSIVTFILIQVSPNFEKSICYMNTGRKPTWEEKAYLEGIMSEIESAAGHPMNYDFYVSNMPQPNAAAMGRHSIMVMRSLMHWLTRDELRGVLAHEVGHLVHQDTVWGLIRYSVSMCGQVAINLLVLIAYAASILTFIPILGLVFLWVVFLMNAIIAGLQFLIRLPASILALSGSRKVEYEADAYAVELGFGEDLYHALSKISQIEPHLNWEQRMLSTHPVTSDRLKKIREEMHARGIDVL